jgi:hypothetical protein
LSDVGGNPRSEDVAVGRLKGLKVRRLRVVELELSTSELATSNF